MGAFYPEPLDKKNYSSGFKKYSLRLRLSAEGFPATEKVIMAVFVADESQDAIQLSGAPYSVSEFASQWKTFDDIPADICERLIRSRTAMLDDLKKMKEIKTTQPTDE